MKLIVGSRGSRLAVIQSELVMKAIAAAHPEIELSLLTMKTTGDRILDRPLDKIGGKGLFVKELDAALREGRTDLTVHSCKDLPADLPADLPLAAFTRREDPRDALVLPLGFYCHGGPVWRWQWQCSVPAGTQPALRLHQATVCGPRGRLSFIFLSFFPFPPF